MGCIRTTFISQSRRGKPDATARSSEVSHVSGTASSHITSKKYQNREMLTQTCERERETEKRVRIARYKVATVINKVAITFRSKYLNYSKTLLSIGILIIDFN